MTSKEKHLKPSRFTKVTSKRRFLSAKPKLKILILGPYVPGFAKSRLIELRDSLRNEGYTQTKLVEDIPDEDIFLEGEEINSDVKNYVKSIRCIRSAHVNYFVFFKKGKNDGVAVELSTTCDKLQHKLNTCAVFIERKYKNWLSTIISGKIKFHENKIWQEYFQNSKDLLDSASACSFEFLRRYHRNMAIR